MSYAGELMYAFPERFRGLVLTAGGLHHVDRQKIKDIFLPVVDQGVRAEDLPYLIEEITDYFTDVRLEMVRSLQRSDGYDERGRRTDVDLELDRAKAILAFNRALQRAVVNFIDVEQNEGNFPLEFDDLNAMERDMSHVNRNYDRLIKGTNMSFIPRMPDYR